MLKGEKRSHPPNRPGQVFSNWDESGEHWRGHAWEMDYVSIADEELKRRKKSACPSLYSNHPNDRPQDNELHSPNLPTQPDTTFVNMSVSGQPKIDLTRYETFREELYRRGDIHAIVDDFSPISTLAAQVTDGGAKSVLSAFAEPTRGRRAVRHSAHLIRVLGDEFAKSAMAISIAKMNLRPNFETRLQIRLGIFG